MTDWKKVQGSQNERPLELDLTTSPHVVYQRRNIERITVEYGGMKTELWQYDERTLSHEEYVAVRSEEAVAVAAIAFITMAEKGEIDDVTAGEHAELFSPWQPGIKYEVGNLRKYNGQLYRCVQAHTSQGDWTPDAAHDLWVKAADPAEEWPEWSQPVGAHDAYNAGDKVAHNGKRWISDLDGNVWEPGVYGWTPET